jgi:hypothetical protein
MKFGVEICAITYGNGGNGTRIPNEVILLGLNLFPFALCNAPSTFQRLMNHFFQSFLHYFVLVFFDNILIYSKNWKSYLNYVDQVLQLISHYQLFLKRSKCSFGVVEVEYLDHIVSKDGV